MGLRKYLVDFFTKKPQSLGEGLKRVKEAFGVVGDDIAKTPGKRLYNTSLGPDVSMSSGYYGLGIEKKITRAGYGTNCENNLAEVFRYYYNSGIGKRNDYGWVMLDKRAKLELNRDTYISRFTGELDGRFNPIMNKSVDKSRTRTLPYNKAVAMGIKPAYGREAVSL